MSSTILNSGLFSELKLLLTLPASSLSLIFSRFNKPNESQMSIDISQLLYPCILLSFELTLLVFSSITYRSFCLTEGLRSSVKKVFSFVITLLQLENESLWSFSSLDETAERSIVSIGCENWVGSGSTSSLGEESLVTIEFLNEDGLP